MNTLIGDKLFQDIPRRPSVTKFRENRPRDVEKSLAKKIYNTTKTTVFAIANAIAGDRNKHRLA